MQINDNDDDDDDAADDFFLLQICPSALTYQIEIYLESLWH